MENIKYGWRVFYIKFEKKTLKKETKGKRKQKRKNKIKEEHND